MGKHCRFFFVENPDGSVEGKERTKFLFGIEDRESSPVSLPREGIEAAIFFQSNCGVFQGPQMSGLGF